jgi:hypothetical protein
MKGGLKRVLKYHHHAAKERAQKAAELLKQAGDELHASFALFEISSQVPDGYDPHAASISSALAEEMVTEVQNLWVKAAELGRL